MKSWLRNSFVAGVAIVALGAGSKTHAQVTEQQATILTSHFTTCRSLFADDPIPIAEVLVSRRHGGIVSGQFSDGVLTVNTTVFKGTKTEPMRLDWESVSPVEGVPPTPVRAVITQLGFGLSKIYLYPKNALFDFGLTGRSVPKSKHKFSIFRKILKARFCYGGTTPTLATLAACPLQGDPLRPETPLGAACEKSEALFFFYFEIDTSDHGPRDGQGPALCRCTDTSFFCDPSAFRQPGGCFGTDEFGNPLPDGVVESAVAAESNNLVGTFENPRCKTKCFDLDGTRVCEKYCKRRR